MIVAYAHWSDVPENDWHWAPWFLPNELADSRDGSLVIVPAFMNWLLAVRLCYNRPMIISSGYRTPQHQQILPGGRTTGSHVSAEAVDVKVYGPHAHELQKVAHHLDVIGMGVHQTDEHASRYLHLDMWDDAPEGVRPNLWSYSFC